MTRCASAEIAPSQPASAFATHILPLHRSVLGLRELPNHCFTCLSACRPSHVAGFMEAFMNSDRIFSGRACFAKKRNIIRRSLRKPMIFPPSSRHRRVFGSCIRSDNLSTTHRRGHKTYVPFSLDASISLSLFKTHLIHVNITHWLLVPARCLVGLTLLLSPTVGSGRSGHNRDRQVQYDGMDSLISHRK
ncbi:uncharacterized protein BT62DRAFT_372970 [Guyanagaster necrorhizus]|uniref:Uncharacterized protein n=1 Tax=Guyanagaster necrorhizus TaxID=856835 RepID=A0A9P7VLI9_9AGAR|nr:uncharacterized protein BT62DRAFT_372970 [Guyanagaster necrorhizus MCA 3950]KAG7442750.1 hypothetical protein BT62DRAFT_372970 [Guyanagaster necrorhizus MCA 3950]